MTDGVTPTTSQINDILANNRVNTEFADGHRVGTHAIKRRAQGNEATNVRAFLPNKLLFHSDGSLRTFFEKIDAQKRKRAKRTQGKEAGRAVFTTEQKRRQPPKLEHKQIAERVDQEPWRHKGLVGNTTTPRLAAPLPLPLDDQPTTNTTSTAITSTTSTTVSTVSTASTTASVATAYSRETPEDAASPFAAPLTTEHPSLSTIESTTTIESTVAVSVFRRTEAPIKLLGSSSWVGQRL